MICFSGQLSCFSQVVYRFLGISVISAITAWKMLTSASSPALPVDSLLWTAASEQGTSLWPLNTRKVFSLSLFQVPAPPSRKNWRDHRNQWQPQGLCRHIRHLAQDHSREVIGCYVCCSVSHSRIRSITQHDTGKSTEADCQLDDVDVKNVVFI